MTRSAPAFILLTLAAPLAAQVTFQRTYGGTMGDGASAVTQTTDGGYIVAGFSRSHGAGWTDLWLIRTDSLGSRLWHRTFGDSGFDQGTSVLETADNGYIVTGWIEPDWAGDFDAWLIKTDASGDSLWTRTYGGTENDAAHSIASTGDGGYVLAGETRSYGAGMSDAWLIRTDSVGDTLWTRTCGGADMDVSFAVQRVEDGGFVLVGYTKSFGAGSFDFYVVRTDPDGDTLWTRTYGGTDSDIGHAVRQTLDGGYILVGYTRSSGMGGYDAWLIKTDSLGDTMWTRVFGGSEHDYARSVRETGDGGYIVAGETGSFGAGQGDLWLIRTDAHGDTLWTRTYGGEDIDYGYCVSGTADGGYVVAGGAKSFTIWEVDAYLVKTDSLGTIGIQEPKTPDALKATAPSFLSRAQLLSELGKNPDLTLFDASGRRVLNHQSVIANLQSLGVLFLRSPSSTRKVLVMR